MKRALNTHIPIDTMLIFACLGLFFGGSTDWLEYADIQSIWPYSLVSLFCFFYGFAFDGKHRIRLVATALLCSSLLTLPLIHFSTDVSSNAFLVGMSLIIGYPLCVYIAHGFHYALHRAEKTTLHYTDLFLAVWNTPNLLFTALLFGGSAHALIMLASNLFKLLGYPFLYQLYIDNHHINYIAFTTFLFLGLGIAQHQQAIINQLRFLMIKMMSFLYPLLAVITSIYFLMYIGQLNHINENTLLGISIFLVILGIIYFNGYFQTGNLFETTLKPLQWIMNSYRIILAILSIIIAIQCYRFFILNTNTLLYLGFIVSITFIYGISLLFNKQKQKQWIMSGNQITALSFLICMLIVNNPFYSLQVNIGLGTQINPFFGTTHAPPTNPLFNEAKANIENTLKQNALSFETIFNPATMNLNPNANGDGLYVCRMQYVDSYKIGQYIHQKCIATAFGYPYSSNRVEILAGKDALTWQPYPEEKNGLPLGVEKIFTSETTTKLQLIAACLAHYQSETYIGKWVNQHCLITVGEKELSVTPEALLGLKKSL